MPSSYKKLFAAGVADAVIGHEADDGFVEDAFLLKSGEHLADFMVGVADRVEIASPIFEQHRIVRDSTAAA